MGQKIQMDLMVHVFKIHRTLPGTCIILSWHFCEHTGRLHFLHRSSSMFFSFPKHETQTGVEFGTGATTAGSSTKMFSPVAQWKILIFCLTFCNGI